VSEENPVALVNLDPTIDELYSRHPLDLGPEDRKKIIASLRIARERWMAEESAARTSGRRVKPSAGIKNPTALQAAIDAVNLEEIDFSE
jgi:hypothetical protein